MEKIFPVRKVSWQHRCREQIYGHQKVKGGGGINWEIGIDVLYTIDTMYKMDN